MAEITVPDTIRVLMSNGRVSVMKLETYLAGAVATAIGTTAPLEAMKAQAVASRTYAARAKRHAEQHADVCTHAHCQKWKRVDPIVAPEVFRAVSETWGTVALYNGELIEAFFFENCAGRTRDAEEMAMPAQPYLRGIECPCGFAEMKGHGVGMCQRGAIVMARQGESFKDILKHYYRDVAVVQTHTDVSPIGSEEKPPSPKKSRATPRTKTPKAVSPPGDEFTALIDSLNQAIGIAPPGEKPAPSKPKRPIEKPQPPPTLTPSPSPASEQGEIVPPTEPPAQTSTPKPTPEPTATPAPAIAPEPAPEPISISALTPQVIHVDNLPGPRMIAGCLSRAGMKVEIEDVRGWKLTVFSGSAPHYGEGGFEIQVQEDGYYTVNVEGKVIEVSLRGETVFLREDNV